MFALPVTERKQNNYSTSGIQLPTHWIELFCCKSDLKCVISDAFTSLQLHPKSIKHYAKIVALEVSRTILFIKFISGQKVSGCHTTSSVKIWRVKTQSQCAVG